MLIQVTGSITIVTLSLANPSPEDCLCLLSSTMLFGSKSLKRILFNCKNKITGRNAGSAAVVGAGLVPFALGTDGGGSIRVPAALCGAVGFMPTQVC